MFKSLPRKSQIFGVETAVSLPPGPILGSVFLWRCFRRQKPLCKPARGYMCRCTVGRRAVGALSETPVAFKVELKEPEPKPFPSVPETKNIYVEYLLSVKQSFCILVFGLDQELATKWPYSWSTGLVLGAFCIIFRA